MQRLVYDPDAKTIVEIIDPCEGTVTGTPHQMFEGTPAQVQSEIERLGLEPQG